MARLFSMGKRLFKLDMDKWRQKRNTGQYLRCYIKPVRDDRNSLAKNIDFYGLLLLVVLTTLALAVIYWGNQPGAYALAAPLALLEVYTAFRLRDFFIKRARIHSSLWVAGRRCLERIKAVGDVGNLEQLFIEILERINGFSDVHRIKLEENESREPGSPIRALLMGVPVAVRCLVPEDNQNTIQEEQVVQFREELEKLDIRGGILVAAGVFSGEARRASLEGRKKTRITLVDSYRLVEMARLTGHQIFPAGAADISTGREPGTNKYRKLVRAALGREKAKGYMTAGGVMLSMYYLASLMDMLSAGYLLFGLINIALAAYCLLCNRESDLLGQMGGNRDRG